MPAMRPLLQGLLQVPVPVPIVAPALLLVFAPGCRPPTPFGVYLDGADIDWWPHDEPLIDGGEVALGFDSVVRVDTLPGAPVQLYVSRGGEGPGPCTLPGGICPQIREPLELFASATTNDEGTARFPIAGDAFDEVGPIAWQALVADPDLEGVVALTEVLVRHVGYGGDDVKVKLEEVTRRAGLDRTMTSGNTHTGGVAFVDLNNDHWPDLYISNGEGFFNYLYRNNGDGTFTFLEDGVPKPYGTIECAGVKAADLENDGDIDLIVPVDNPEVMISFVPQPAEGGPNLLYLNRGDGTFEPDPIEQARDAGLADPRQVRNSSAAVADYDLDGCIDVYLTHWAMAAEPGGTNFDRLLKGRCDGTFEDVTQELGVDGKGRDGLVGFWWDHDFDRYPELYVGNNSDKDDGPVLDPSDVFYRNRGGTFEEWTEDPIGYDAWAAMGVDVGDIDADGDWDMYITDVWMLPPEPKGNALYLGTGDGRFTENRCHEAGLCFGYNSWPTNFEDFDNDGWVDVWVGSSLPRKPDMLFLNRADGTGRFVTHRQEGFLGHIARAGTTADYDGDGDMDIFLFDEGSASSLWNNRYINGDDPDLTGKHWVALKLVGVQSNRAAIGALVRTEVGGVKMMRRVTGGDSAHSHRDLTLHFGLGDAEELDQIEILWPQPPDRSPPEIVTGLTADRLWIIDEGSGIRPHAFVDPQATWEDGVLTVRTASNYGGRPDIEVVGHGPLAYRADEVRYEATFDELAVAPSEVVLRTPYGPDRAVPVDDRE